MNVLNELKELTIERRRILHFEDRVMVTDALSDTDKHFIGSRGMVMGARRTNDCPICMECDRSPCSSSEPNYFLGVLTTTAQVLYSCDYTFKKEQEEQNEQDV